MQPVGRFRIAADHPSLPGHFPGHPVVPGVVLLDEILVLLQATPTALPQVKFLAPVLPGEWVEVSAQPGPARIGFSASVAGREVLRGALGLAAP